MNSRNNICGIVSLFAFVSLATIALGENVYFPDANLEAAIRDELNIPSPTPITTEDMLGLTCLYAESQNISSLEGLQYATNMYDLALGFNQISDITPLSGLVNMRFLYLSGNQIRNISACSAMTNLTSLILWEGNTGISDLSPLTNLTNLCDLWLCGGSFQDISALSGMKKLGGLRLDYCNVSDISPLSEMINMRYLWLQGNQISDVSPLVGMSNIFELFLDDNTIEILDFSGSSFNDPDFIILGNNPLQEVLLTNATINFQVFNILFDDTWGLASIPGVQKLDMCGVNFLPISDLSAIYQLDDLQTLLLANALNLNGIDVVRFTQELDSLNWLDVTGLWDSFDINEKTSLSAWDAIPGNTLVMPEPATMSLLTLGGLALLRRRRK